MRLDGDYTRERIIGELAGLDGRPLPPRRPAKSGGAIRRADDDQHDTDRTHELTPNLSIRFRDVRRGGTG